MAKAHGNTRIVQPYKTGREKNLKEYNDMIATGKYDINNSSVSDSGAYVAYMEGHNYNKDEVDVARYLADNGFDVVLTPEGDGFEIHATNTRVGKEGENKHRYSDGKVSMYTYEQRTPDHIRKDAETSVRGAIRHANLKRSEIALIYDKNSLFHRKDIEDGMRYYQQSDKAWRHKVKVVLVVNSRGEVNEHQFDKE